MAKYIDPMKPIIEEFMTDFRIEEENHIMRAVMDVGIFVDKPRLMQALTDAKRFYEEGYRAAMNKADVVEVVRCKDCVYANDDGTICRYYVGRDTRPDKYCSEGERKGEGE